MKKTILAIACGMAFTPLAHAETDNSFVLDEVVVTATRLEQSLFSTIQHTTIITEEELQNSQAPDLPSLLRQRAGIEVAQQGGIGKQSSTFMRGTESDHTLVLLDGIRISSATTSATALDQIMLDDIERIEIVRGNVSSIYGSEAIGGVIQIFTKKGKGIPRGSVGAGLGSYGTKSARLSYGGEINDTRFHLGISHRDTDGFSAIKPEYTTEPDVDGYRNTTFNLTASHRLAADHEIGMTIHHSGGDVEYDDNWTIGSDESEQTVQSLSLFSRNQINDTWLSRFTLAWSRDELDSFLNSAPRGHVHTQNRQAEWLNELAIAANQTTTLGLAYLGQEVSSDSFYTRTKRNVKSLTAGYLGEFGAHTLQLNARHDDYSDFGGHSTGLLGYGYAFTPNLKAVASISSAFRAPSFNDLYNPAWGGNPDLNPEKANSREAGIQYGHHGLNAKLVYFDTRIEDLIIYVWPTGNENIQRAEIDGWEGSLSGSIGPYTLRASLTLQDPVNVSTGQPLLRRAERFGSLSVSRELGNLLLNAEVKASGPRQDYHITDLSVIEMPGYAVWNLSGTYRLSEAAKVDFRLENLFDKDYSLVHGYNTPGRSLYVNLNWQF